MILYDFVIITAAGLRQPSLLALSEFGQDGAPALGALNMVRRHMRS